MKLLLAIAIFAGAIVGQERMPLEATYDLVGRVKDRAGRAVKQAHVRITNGTVDRWTVTNTFGYFKFHELPGGPYIVEVCTRRYSPVAYFVDPRFDPYLEIVLLE